MTFQPTKSASSTSRPKSDESIADRYCEKSTGLEWSYPKGVRVLNPQERRIVNLIAEVESGAVYQAYTGMAGGGISDAAFTEFSARWIVEELRHGELLRLASGPSGVDDSRIAQRERLNDSRKLASRLAPTVARVLRLLFGDAFLASYCVAGALVERSVIETYRLLEARLPGTAVADVLPAIIRQEANHLAFYQAKAIALRRGPLARRLSDLYAMYLWQPLARNTLGHDRWAEVVRFCIQEDRDLVRFIKVDQYARECLGIRGFNGWRRRLESVGYAIGS